MTYIAVVPVIARYSMDPTTPEEKKRHIIHSLSKTLSIAFRETREFIFWSRSLPKGSVDSIIGELLQMRWFMRFVKELLCGFGEAYTNKFSYGSSHLFSQAQ
ncbi:hypothetical protein RND71_036839 [Anisodus tanguticus]|uniref:Uncharacterized protein n=1 Tax=Anisodus tanguticus TaxID=243964 RepID=A0AAE1R1R4_9SOLA|nr:hypothetical protein RND71_036839 [Anisodus tanguticus]